MEKAGTENLPLGEYLLAKFGIDTAENEPCKVCPLSAYRSPRLETMYTSKQKLKADKSLLEGFMIRRKIPSLLQARALDDLDRKDESELVHKEFYDKVLDKLTPVIRQKIREELYVTVMKRHPFFAQIPADALRYLCGQVHVLHTCLLYTSPSPRDATLSRMPSSA